MSDWIEQNASFCYTHLGKVGDIAQLIRAQRWQR